MGSEQTPTHKRYFDISMSRRTRRSPYPVGKWPSPEPGRGNEQQENDTESPKLTLENDEHEAKESDHTTLEQLMITIDDVQVEPDMTKQGKIVSPCVPGVTSEVEGNVAGSGSELKQEGQRKRSVGSYLKFLSHLIKLKRDHSHYDSSKKKKKNPPLLLTM